MININIKSKNFSMTPEIEEYITSKISSVEKFLQMSHEENVLVEFEVEQSKHHKKGEVYRAEANLSVRGKLFRGDSTKYDVKTAIDNVKDQLEKQIRRSKTKRFELFEKGARVIKNILRRNNNV
jgi:ribosomal subunit interface protein